MAYSLKAIAEQYLPIGMIVAFYGTTPPSGWLICDGRDCTGTELAKRLGITKTPDLRGKFIRGLGGNSAAMAVEQGDCIRNITGTHDMSGEYSENNASGAFYYDGKRGNHGSASSDWDNMKVTFDASRVVPTGPENRPVNMAFNYIIKANFN